MSRGYRASDVRHTRVRTTLHLCWALVIGGPPLVIGGVNGGAASTTHIPPCSTLMLAREPHLSSSHHGAFHRSWCRLSCQTGNRVRTYIASCAFCT